MKFMISLNCHFLIKLDQRSGENDLLLALSKTETEEKTY